MEKIDPKQLSPLVLAYIGDAVYELYVRLTMVQNNPTAKSRSLHKASTSLVRASSQAETLKKLLPLLTEEEMEQVKRARNCHVNHITRGATRAEYQASTAFEALIGYLYLANKQERLIEILANCASSEDPPEYPQFYNQAPQGDPE
ncbi:MAG: ribonuclease III [Firmicutes bacterium]|jgi:ribonuclease-3 family protein|nr:ribonuclease III [Bacillota bacterium]HQD39355.1 ribonuclease III domain-containing protein [Bacillota bacterium]